MSNHYPFIKDQLDHLGSGIYFTFLDMSVRLRRISAEPESVHMTTLLTPDIYFRLTNTHEVFQHSVYFIDCLMSKPNLLSLFNSHLSTELRADASSLGYGVTLIQKKGDQIRVTE